MKIKIGDLTQKQINTICSKHNELYGQCYGCPFLVDFPFTGYLVCVKKLNKVEVNIPEELLK